VFCFCHFIFGAAKITILIPQKEHLKIHQLSLVNFKNHVNLKLDINNDVVAVCGLNGVGKTTVLDAIYFLCVGKSYFSATDVQCIQNNEVIAGIRARVEDEDTNNLKVVLKRGSKKVIEKNDSPYKRVMDHLGQYFAVVIAPGDIELIYGTNSVRRNFVNQILSQTDSEYLSSLVKYNKLLEHRNKHLKQEIVDDVLLQTIDDQVGPLAKEIFEKRAVFLKEFSAQFKEEYNTIANSKEHVELNYKSQLQELSYAELVMQNRTKDLAVQRSFSGVHKDEIEIELEGVSLKKYGSQGQIKSALIALKLAEYSYVAKLKNKLPFLLLDDIFEKIDDERALVLTSIIKNGNFGQIFITDTNAERLESFCEHIGKPYQLEKLV
jgi:DNA replication and repair protein RecF